MELPNKLHLLQTAEGIRKAGHEDWFQLVGLLHDVSFSTKPIDFSLILGATLSTNTYNWQMGKIMFLWGYDEDGQNGSSSQAKQWALGGDTFVVGCSVPKDAVVFPQFNELNPDMNDSRYNSKNGMYTPHCGLDQLCFAWGHDEYLYRMLRANGCTLPQAGLDMIRYHSAYPLHEKRAYRHLLRDGDEERIEWVRKFNQFDLYTKDEDNDIRCNMESLMVYYRKLLNKYGLDGKLKW